MSVDIVWRKAPATSASPALTDPGQPEKAQATRHKWVIEKEPPTAPIAERGGGCDKRIERSKLPRGWVRVMGIEAFPVGKEKAARGTKTNQNQRAKKAKHTHTHIPEAHHSPLVLYTYEREITATAS